MKYGSGAVEAPPVFEAGWFDCKFKSIISLVTFRSHSNGMKAVCTEPDVLPPVFRLVWF